MRAIVLAASVLLTASIAVESRAGDAFLLGHQGILTDAGGSPLADGNYNITFRIFDDVSAGTLLWAETLSVSVQSGKFSAELGHGGLLTTDVLTCTLATGALCPRFLELEVTPNPPLSPRVQLLASPFSGVAQRVQGDVETRPGEIILSAPVATIKHAASPGDTPVRMRFVNGSVRRVIGLNEEGEMILVRDSEAPTAHIGLRIHLDDDDVPDVSFSTNPTTQAKIAIPLSVDPSATGNPVLSVDPGKVAVDPNQDGFSVVEIDELLTALYGDKLSHDPGNTGNPDFEVGSGSMTMDPDQDGVPEQFLLDRVLSNDLDLFGVDVDGDGQSEVQFGQSPPTPNPYQVRFRLTDNALRVTDISDFELYSISTNQATTIVPALFRSPVVFNFDGDANNTARVSSSQVAVDINDDGTQDFEVNQFPSVRIVARSPVHCREIRPEGVEVTLLDGAGNVIQRLNSAGAQFERPTEWNAQAIFNEAMMPFGGLTGSGTFSWSGGAATFSSGTHTVRSADFVIDRNGDLANDFEVVLDPVHQIRSVIPVRIENDLDVTGDLTVSGNKGFAHDHPFDPSKQIIYIALEGGESGTYARGAARLEKGVAVIDLPDHFALVTSEEGLTAQVTPTGPVHSMLYVESKSTKQLVVRALSPSDADASFDYMVNGVRAGFEGHEVIREKSAFADRE